MDETQNTPQQPPVQNNNTGSATAGKSNLPGLEGFFDTYLNIKAPFQLPAGVKEFIVKYGPWITLVILILAAIVIVPLALLAFGLTAATVPAGVAVGYAGNTVMGMISLILALVTLVMEAIAIPKLLKRQLGGWKLVYYASLISALSSLLSLNIVSLVLGLLIGMYVLFQIRGYYK